MSYASTPSIAAARLRDEIASGEGLLLLDVRDPDTCRSFPFEPPRAVPMRNIPYQEFLRDIERGLRELPSPDQAGRIVCFCYRGVTAVGVVQALRAAGYQAENLQGGMRAWAELVVPAEVPGSGALDSETVLLQLRRLGKGCLGYALVSHGEALLVDVGRNVEAALEAVAARGARVVRAADTHLHADHISGGPVVARETGAEYLLPPADAKDVGLKYEPVTDGTVWRVGGVQVQALHTPGHTDGSTSYLVGGRYLLTGDTLFVTGVGRPDLSGQGERLARVLHRTLTTTLMALPDRVEVLPAHISGSAEIGSGGVASASLAELKRATLAKLPTDPDIFARELLAALPAQPPNYETIRAANRGVAVDDPSELEYGPNRCAVTGAGM
jgi:glyoxylase-like metal-dependent hydrolase (beta-lactamase superfamily II)